MNIKIPKVFDEKLDGNFRALIDNTASKFSNILVDNKLEFFSEFTDHGITHIEEVLETASNIINEKSYNFLNKEDITVLIMAVILHDVGMHITSEGLNKLLECEFDEFRVDFFDKLSWKQTWNDFFYEAKRFNEEQLTNIFGKADVEILQPDFNNLDDVSRKLCGEFIRRHHHRLAHEIAIGGFPTKVGEDNIMLLDNIDSEILDLCGLVARSHGMNLRDTFNYLTEAYDMSWRLPYNVKVFFLMVVLRISDYIQIHSERASSVLIKTKRFSSPISIQEWEKHNSIKQIDVNTTDPERIFINAKPQNSKIYLELKKLFNDIQYEFDLSWAILGEVYGMDNRLNNLKIKYRRITSNLDYKTKFSKTVNYIPEKIRFDADPELLKLLIGPLYGEDPKYGVRELLQNSVDATKEREFIDDSFEKKISIRINTIDSNEKNKKYSFTIKDKGIGMTQDTIINFFFKAGASFRNSMLWKKNFIENDSVQVEKTGRFGVGILAAFLLGSEFELKTRYYLNDTGYSCNASLNTSQIELLKCDCEVGTEIKITLNNEVNSSFLELINNLKNSNDHNYSTNRYKNNNNRNKLEWFTWYNMDFPEIEYQIEDEELIKIFEYNYDEISSIPEKPKKGWNSFKTDIFKGIHWTIDTNRDDRDHFYYDDDDDEIVGKSDLFCNGFKITRGFKIIDYPWNIPDVSVFDGDARMPLSLSRDYLLNDRLPFETELVENICNYVIDALLKTEFDKIGNFYIPRDNILNLKTNLNLSNYIVVSDDKFTLVMPSIFKSLNLKTFYQLWIKESSNPKKLFNNKNAFYQAKSIKNDPIYFYKGIMDTYFYAPPNHTSWFSLDSGNKRRDLQHNYYVQNDKLLYLLEKNRLSKSFKEKIDKQLFNEKWSVIKNSNVNNVYSYTGVSKKQKQKIKLPETKISKEDLSAEDFFFIKENFISDADYNIFEKFKNVWVNRFNNDNFLIPINKEYRK